MFDQYRILKDALHWEPATALALFAIGTLYAMQGFRFARFLFAVSAAVAGFAVAAVIAAATETPPIVPGLAAGAVLGIVALLRLSVGVTFGAIVTFGFYGVYFAERMGFSQPNVITCAVAGLFLGAALAWGGQRSLPILISTMQGAVLMVLGFVGVAHILAADFATTFVAWSSRFGLVVPLLMTMLIVMGYSVQANAQQGDLRNGSPGATNWKSEDEERMAKA